MSSPQSMPEKDYRALVDASFKKLENAFDQVDPDLAEFELSQGAITIQFADKSKLILSTQPSVRQIWIAYAAKGIAHHFNYDASSKSWFDDKGKGLELLNFVQSVVSESAKVSINFS